jgi:dTDP-4-dehydrorhamnose 3,5-epimerase
MNHFIPNTEPLVRPATESDLLRLPSGERSHSGAALEVRKTLLNGLIELRPRIFSDARGSFTETFHTERLAEAGICETFVQDNLSRSLKGTMRGFHYQLRRPQAKLCWVVEGEALDVALDIRLSSPTFGKAACVLLSAEMQNQIFIPAGFAHAFLALSDTVQFIYKCSDFYDPQGEYGILWSDPALGVEWGIKNPLVSDKDARFTPLANVPRHLLPR